MGVRPYPRAPSSCKRANKSPPHLRPALWCPDRMRVVLTALSTIVVMTALASPALAGTRTYTLRHGPVRMENFNVAFPKATVKAPKVNGYIVGHERPPRGPARPPDHDPRRDAPPRRLPPQGAAAVARAVLEHGRRADLRHRGGAAGAAVPARLRLPHPPRRPLAHHRDADEPQRRARRTPTSSTGSPSGPASASRPCTRSGSAPTAAASRSATRSTAAASPGSTSTRSSTWRVPYDGRIVAVGGHLHGGARNMWLSQPRCGGRRLLDTAPRFGDARPPLLPGAPDPPRARARRHPLLPLAHRHPRPARGAAPHHRRLRGQPPAPARDGDHARLRRARQHDPPPLQARSRATAGSSRSPARSARARRSCRSRSTPSAPTAART